MDVNIDQSGADDEPARHIDDADVSIDAELSADTGNPVGIDEHIKHAVASVRWIDDAPAS
jgi:hypothetical protein